MDVNHIKFGKNIYSCQENSGLYDDVKTLVAATTLV